jgi:hypothetical protein
MKKKIITMLTTVLACLFLSAGLTFGQYDDGNNGYEYDNSVYSDYEYQLDNAAHHLDRHRSPVYYFHHPRAGLYFVLVGDTTFVVPAYIFRPYLHRHNFVWVPRTRFITLSCCGLDYYDSYLRFNFYFDFYNRSRWNRRYHRKLRQDFRRYYTNRRHNKWYHTNRPRIMRQRVDAHKRYKHEITAAGIPKTGITTTKIITKGITTTGTTTTRLTTTRLTAAGIPNTRNHPQKSIIKDLEIIKNKLKAEITKKQSPNTRTPAVTGQSEESSDSENKPGQPGSKSESSGIKKTGLSKDTFFTESCLFI